MLRIYDEEGNDQLQIILGDDVFLYYEDIVEDGTSPPFSSDENEDDNDDVRQSDMMIAFGVNLNQRNNSNK